MDSDEEPVGTDATFSTAGCRRWPRLAKRQRPKASDLEADIDSDSLTSDGCAEPDDADASSEPADTGPTLTTPRPAITRSRVRTIAIVALVSLALALACGAAYFKYKASKDATSNSAAESVRVAKEATVAMLSYTPQTAEATLGAAGDRLTGAFRDSYRTLINDVVIPGAKQKHISATASVPAAASVSATSNHAVVLVFVDQNVVFGTEPPTQTASAVQVTLDKVADHWLISGFDPK
jgi:Mce-associated membrane protein